MKNNLTNIEIFLIQNDFKTNINGKKTKEEMTLYR